MAETEIPNGHAPVTTGEVDQPNGHGPGYDGLRTANGHAPKPGQKPVTLAIVGAGQRGQVSRVIAQALNLPPLMGGRSTRVTRCIIPNWPRSWLLPNRGLIDARSFPPSTSGWVH